MCWIEVVEGTTIIDQFNPNKSSKGATYLVMLKNVFRPKDRSLATRNSYWFQGGGATVHTTIVARDWLRRKFGDRVISCLTDRPWPA